MARGQSADRWLSTTAGVLAIATAVLHATGYPSISRLMMEAGVSSPCQKRRRLIRLSELRAWHIGKSFVFQQRHSKGLHYISAVFGIAIASACRPLILDIASGQRITGS